MIDLETTEHTYVASRRHVRWYGVATLCAVISIGFSLDMHLDAPLISFVGSMWALLSFNALPVYVQMHSAYVDAITVYSDYGRKLYEELRIELSLNNSPISISRWRYRLFQKAMKRLICASSV